MSVQGKVVPVVTASDGSFSATVRGECVLRAVELTLGTLSTPDLSITSEPAGTVILAEAGIATDKLYFPTAVAQDADGADIAGSYVPFAVPNRLEIAISGGGDTKTGSIKLIYER